MATAKKTVKTTMDPRKRRLPRGATVDDRMTVPDDPENKNAKMGRPTNYEFRFAREAEGLCLLNLTNRELAHHFQVDEGTLNHWIALYPDFKKAIHDGREGADQLVARALFARAVGYSHPDTDIRTVGVGNGVSEIVQTPIVKHYPPETGAATMWLTNRQRNRWRSPNSVGDNSGASPTEQAAATRAAIRAALAELDEPGIVDDDPTTPTTGE